MTPAPAPKSVPYRTILATIGLVLATAMSLLVLRELGRIIAWLVVAGFIAVVLNPAVSAAQRYLHLRRGLAAVLVLIVGISVTAGLIYTFVRPLVDQVQQFVDDLPQLVDEAKAGRGPVGKLVQRYNVDEWIEENQDRFREGLESAGAPALDIVRTLANTVVAFLTIMVLAVLMLLQGPRLIDGSLKLIENERRRERVRRVAADCSRAVTGYMAGNLLISIIAGATSFAFFTIAGVPFKGVLALWVGFADLIPLVGATLGAVPAVGVAFLHSPTAGVATLIWFILYQQFENHVLQVTVMSRTVDLNPLAVLVSVLVGVELTGILGALLAIPAAAVIQVVVRDMYDERQMRMKAVPTIGATETPMVDAPVFDDLVPAPAKRPAAKRPAAKRPAVKKAAVKKAAVKKVPAKKAAPRKKASAGR